MTAGEPTTNRISAELQHGETAMNAEESKSPATGRDQAPENAGGHERQTRVTEPRRSRAGLLLALVVVGVVIAIVVAAIGIVKRMHASAELIHYTDTMSAPPVSLAQPVFEKSAREIVLPGNMQAFTLAPIYARTTGYVKAWYHDIGAHVHKGELLAVIETPELDQQLAQAKADLATAQSNAGAWPR